MQFLTLVQAHDTLEAQIQDIRANLGEVREQAAHRFASEAERLQDQNEELFLTWSEGLKEDLEQRHHRFSEQLHGEQMAVELRLQHIEARAQASGNGAKGCELESSAIHVEVHISTI